MKVFCIDVGNTSTHFGVLECGAIIVDARVDTHDLASASVFIEMVQEHEVDGIVFSSVVPRVSSLLVRVFEPLGLPYFSLKPKHCEGLKITSENPHLIGQDLLANALGAQKHYGEPVIVVDMRTATTLNTVTEVFGFEGGIIAPGFQMLTNALHEKNSTFASSYARTPELFA